MGERQRIFFVGEQFTTLLFSSLAPTVCQTGVEDRMGACLPPRTLSLRRRRMSGREAVEEGTVVSFARDFSSRML